MAGHSESTLRLFAEKLIRSFHCKLLTAAQRGPAQVGVRPDRSAYRHRTPVSKRFLFHTCLVNRTSRTFPQTSGYYLLIRWSHRRRSPPRWEIRYRMMLPRSFRRHTCAAGPSGRERKKVPSELRYWCHLGEVDFSCGPVKCAPNDTTTHAPEGSASETTPLTLS